MQSLGYKIALFHGKEVGRCDNCPLNAERCLRKDILPLYVHYLSLPTEKADLQ